LTDSSDGSGVSKIKVFYSIRVISDTLDEIFCACFVIRLVLVLLSVKGFILRIVVHGDVRTDGGVKA